MAIHDFFLTDLMIKAPEVSDNLGRNVKEMIALRCLEALFSGITNDVHPVVHSKMGFDPSESCEDVLQCILRKVTCISFGFDLVNYLLV